MLPELLQKSSFFHLLYRIDQSLLEQQQEKQCPYCGGPLYQAHYLRKPRGGPDNIPEDYLVRFSLCCGREECRKRTMPKTCRFMGRRVYWAAVILIVMALRQRRNNSVSAGKLQKLFNISRNTLKSWFRYFRATFPQSSTWQVIRGMVQPTVKNSALPGALFWLFFQNTHNAEEALLQCLRLLAK
jgi:hypothetical protein